MSEMLGIIFAILALLTFGFVLISVIISTAIVLYWLGIIVVRWVFKKTLGKELEGEE